jgi:hypothetical protein
MSDIMCKIHFVSVPGRFGSANEPMTQKLVCSTHQWDFSNAVSEEAGPVPDRCPLGKLEARVAALEQQSPCNCTVAQILC